MALVSKKKTPSSAPKSRIVQVNPYENPDNVMELMAKISSAKPSADDNFFWDAINKAYENFKGRPSLSEYIEENREHLLDKDFEYKFREQCGELLNTLKSHENSYHTQIVVAGGFSSGKSSFLNRLTGSAGLLPTGVEPVSVVKTYLYCSQHTKNIAVRGVNQQNVLVSLHPGVLQAIQHAKQSNVYLASVLDKLFVEIPSRDMDGLVFIDTPGYNNSDRANDSNGKTDRATALEALGEGDVLFWIVDSERGALVAEDIEMMKQFEGKKLIIFNKADKKGEKEMAGVLQTAANTLLQTFPEEELIDVIAFSTLENKLYGSYKNKRFAQVLQEVKGEGIGEETSEELMIGVVDLLNREIVACETIIEEQEKEYREHLKDKQEWEKLVREAKENHESVIEGVRNVLLDSYNEVMAAADASIDSSSYGYDSFLKFYNGVMDFENNDHWGSSSILTRAINAASRSLDRFANKHNAAIDYKYYEYDYRNSLVDNVKGFSEETLERYQEWYEEVAEACSSCLERVKYEKGMKKAFEAYKQHILSALLSIITEFKKRNKALTVTAEADDIPNVFDCIARNDYKAFLRSFEKGVDLSVCNPDGYSPLTLAVKQGHNMMVQFMLDHDADPTVQDRRGYNAFHTAVECQYRHLCQMLLDVDPDLLDSRTAQGETVAQLAQRQSFAQWMEQEIDNAY